MADFEDAAAELADQEEARLARVATMKATPLQRHELIGAAFRPGERVIDLITGQGGTVVHTAFENVLTKTP